MKPLDKAKNSKTFCIYPWVHQYIGPPGDVKPCCVYHQDMQLGSLKENTLEEIWNNENTKKMRLDMLNGEKPKGCDICWRREDIVYKTHRVDANENLFKEDVYDLVNMTEEDGTLPVHQLKYIDARWNNLCNLKCRTCGPRFSTSWIEDHALLFDRTMEEVKASGDGFQFSGKTEDQLLKEIWPHIPHLKQIYFAGGEPLMQIEHYKILEELIRIGHTGSKERPLVINYNTNFSQLKLGKHQALEYWKHFKNLKVNASLDGSHQRAEYWRKGTDWNTVVENRKRMKELCPGTEFKISYTLSWPNSYNLLTFHKEWVHFGLINANDISLNILETPPYFCIKFLPTWKKDKIKELYLDHIEWLKSYQGTERVIREFNDVITFMYSFDSGNDLTNKERFVAIQSKLDKLRKENFWSVFPEHLDLKELVEWPQ